MSILNFFRVSLWKEKLFVSKTHNWYGLYIIIRAGFRFWNGCILDNQCQWAGVLTAVKLNKFIAYIVLCCAFHGLAISNTLTIVLTTANVMWTLLNTTNIIYIYEYRFWVWIKIGQRNVITYYITWSLISYEQGSSLFWSFCSNMGLDKLVGFWITNGTLTMYSIKKIMKHFLCYYIISNPYP